jgi:hypothetical protein
MRFRALLLAILTTVSVSAIAGPFDEVTPCHDMAHLLDAGATAEKAEHQHPQDGPKSFCQAPPGTSGVQVCMRALTDKVDTNYIVSYEIDGKIMQRWTEEGFVLMDPFTSFTVESVDLGGQGRVDTIIGVVENVTADTGSERWALYIVPPGGKTLIGPIDVDDYMSMSGLYRVPERGGCILLASKWDLDSEPGRGEGTYIKGHFYALYGDKFGAVDGLPPVEHRLLDSFEKAMSKAGSPFPWFKEPNTRILGP